MYSKEWAFIEHMKKHWLSGEKMNVSMYSSGEMFCITCDKDIYQIWGEYKVRISQNIEKYIDMEDF